MFTGYTRTLEYDSRRVVWSPDSRVLYYALRDQNNLADIWVENILTGEKRSLSKTPDQDEDLATLWPANLDVLIMYTTPGFPDGVGWIGYLTIMRTNGSEYQIISHSPLTSFAAPSPDGHTIAYATYEDDLGYVPWYFRLGSQPQRFPWPDFGLADFKDMSFSSPSWSSDGRRLAWWMWSYDNSY